MTTASQHLKVDHSRRRHCHLTGVAVRPLAFAYEADFVCCRLGFLVEY